LAPELSRLVLAEHGLTAGHLARDKMFCFMTWGNRRRRAEFGTMTLRHLKMLKASRRPPFGIPTAATQGQELRALWDEFDSQYQPMKVRQVVDRFQKCLVLNLSVAGGAAGPTTTLTKTGTRVGTRLPMASVICNLISPRIAIFQ
jgi:hypothetical protein